MKYSKQQTMRIDSMLFISSASELVSSEWLTLNLRTNKFIKTMNISKKCFYKQE